MSYFKATLTNNSMKILNINESNIAMAAGPVMTGSFSPDLSGLKVYFANQKPVKKIL